jgi:hypothetical protein
MGSLRLEPEHALLSLVWDPESVQSAMLHRVGTSRVEVQRALGRLGVPVPPNDPPPEDERPRGERVWVPVDHFELLLSEVQSRLPRDSPFAFNFAADGRAWMRAGADVDLQAIVDDVLSSRD